MPGPGPRARRRSTASCRCSATSASSTSSWIRSTWRLAFHAVRLYAGYSGWGPGQLEHELAQDAWFVVDAEPDDPFLPDGAALWQRILARQGGPLARLALFPVDPSLN